jgi:glycosyltransferase involved in cell wall biosynthesis
MNLRKPRFSIVIPLFNKEATIASTINTALNQEFSDFEVLIVDDGSTDNSLNIARSFCDDRIKVFTKENGGVSSARNFAIENADGEYIAFLDADDFWEPEYLKEMSNFIDRYSDCGLYASAFKKITHQKTIIVGDEVNKGVSENFFETRIKHLVPFTSATIVDKEVFNKVGNFPKGMIGGEDDFMWSKIAIKYKTAFNPDVLVSYNFVNNGIAFRKGKPDTCTESWFDLLKEGDFYRNEFIAQKARKTSYTKLSKKKWQYLFVLNRMPYNGIALYYAAKGFYKSIKINFRKVFKRWARYFKMPLFGFNKIHNSV